MKLLFAMEGVIIKSEIDIPMDGDYVLFMEPCQEEASSLSVAMKQDWNDELEADGLVNGDFEVYRDLVPASPLESANHEHDDGYIDSRVRDINLELILEAYRMKTVTVLVERLSAATILKHTKKLEKQPQQKVLKKPEEVTRRILRKRKAKSPQIAEKLRGKRRRAK